MKKIAGYLFLMSIFSIGIVYAGPMNDLHAIKIPKPGLEGTIEILHPTEGQTITAGESVSISIQGTGDTKKAAVFAFFGSESWADIVDLPWEQEVNVPLNSVGSNPKIMVMGMDENMNMFDTDEVSLALSTSIELQEILFGFGDKWRFDFKSLPDQPNDVQLRPIGKFSDGSEHMLSILEGTEYSSANEAVATVDSEGLVTVYSEGTAEIAVTNSGKSKILIIEVIK